MKCLACILIASGSAVSFANGGDQISVSLSTNISFGDNSNDILNVVPSGFSFVNTYHDGSSNTPVLGFPTPAVDDLASDLSDMNSDLFGPQFCGSVILSSGYYENIIIENNGNYSFFGGGAHDSQISSSFGSCFSNLEHISLNYSDTSYLFSGPDGMFSGCVSSEPVPPVQLRCDPTFFVSQLSSSRVRLVEVNEIILIDETGQSQSRVYNHRQTSPSNNNSPVVFSTIDSVFFFPQTSGHQYRFQFLQLFFTDKILDANGDGRFSYSDIVSLSDLVQQGGYNINFDFDGDGLLELADIDLLSRVLTIDGGSGILGDANQDGIADCADLPTASSHSFAGEILGSTNYIIEFDADLDGDNDGIDKSMVAIAIQPADITGDFSVNFFDTSLFLTWFNAQDSRADLNSDGAFNFFDITEWTSLLAQACP